MALGADFAIIYLNWAMVQKAADAAALAGASQLTAVPGSAPSVTPSAENYVYGYACLNGISDPGKTYPTLCGSEASHPGGFADQIVFTNVTDTTVQEGIGTVPSGLYPVGFQCKAPCSLKNLNGGGSVTFGQKFVGTVGASGNWQWVDVGQGSSASRLGSLLQSGSTESFSVGQVINSSTGTKGNSNPATAGLANRLASCSAANNTNFAGSAFDPCANGASVGGADGIGGSASGAVPINDPCLVTVPVVDFTGCNGNCSLTIEGFAQVYLEQDSTSTSMDACYVQGSTTTNLAGSPTAPDLGPTTPPLLIN
jgi:hypothetical protein